MESVSLQGCSPFSPTFVLDSDIRQGFVIRYHALTFMSASVQGCSSPEKTTLPLWCVSVYGIVLSVGEYGGFGFRRPEPYVSVGIL